MSKRNERSDSDRVASSPYDEPTSAFSVPAGMSRVEDLDDIDPTELATTPLIVPSKSKLDRRPAGAQQRSGEPDDGLEVAEDDQRSRTTSARESTPRVTKRVAPRTPTPITELGGEPPLPLTKPLDEDADYEGDGARTEPVAVGVEKAEPETVALSTESIASDADDHEAADRDRDDDVRDDRSADPRRGTLDTGLLLLRVAVGLIAMAHGAQKLFGWWSGPGLDGFEAFLRNSPDPSIGFAPKAVHALSIIGPVIETGGGALLILGLLTPLAASGLLGTMILAATYNVTLHGSFSFFAPADGIEYELLLVVCAAALILTGPGRIALDSRWGWSRRPMWGSLVFLVIGVAGGIVSWIVFNGVNPLR